MEYKKEISDIFKDVDILREINSLEDVDTLEELLAVQNVEAVSPNDNDIISVREESMIEECLNDTDGSLSSVNLEFFNDHRAKLVKGRRKKTMEKRKEERLGFRYLVPEAASDNEDDEDCSSISSMDSDFMAEIKKLEENTFLHTRFRNRVKDKLIGESNVLKNIKKKLELKLIKAKVDKGRKSESKSDNERNLEHLLEKHAKLFRRNLKIDNMKIVKGRKRLLRSQSGEEPRRNYEEDKSESEQQIDVNDVTNEGLQRELSDVDLKASTSKNGNGSKVDRGKRRLLSPKSGKEKSESVEEFNKEVANKSFDDVDAPSTSKNTNVPKNREGGIKRILSDSDEEEKSESGEEWNITDGIGRSSSKKLNAKKKTVRRKRRVSAKKQDVAENVHIYSFFSSMADLVSKLPYSTTLNAKVRVTRMLEAMVERLEKENSDWSPIGGHEISEEDMNLIKMRLSRLPYIY